MDKTLTDLNIRVLRAISDYIDREKISPSIRELMGLLDYTSPAPVQMQLDRLKAFGCVTWIEGKSRTLRLTEKGTETVLETSTAPAIELAQSVVEYFNGSVPKDLQAQVEKILCTNR